MWLRLKSANSKSAISYYSGLEVLGCFVAGGHQGTLIDHVLSTLTVSIIRLLVSEYVCGMHDVPPS